MRINNELKKMASYNPTKQTFSMNTRELNEQIAKNKITLPLYQRDVSWVLKKSIELLNYQLNGKAPVSPISINKISNLDEYVPQVSIIDRELIDTIKVGQLTVTDGQQRLTTNYKAHINHPDFRNIVLDLSKGKFRIVEDSIKKFQIPVGILLNNNDDVFYEYLTLNKQLQKPEAQSTLVQIRSKLRDYNYTINLAEDLTEDEQIEWFEVLNNAGSRVSRIQMSFSKLKLEDIDIYVQYTKPFMQKLEEYGYDGIFDVKTTEVSIPIANLNPAYEIIKGQEHKLNYAPIPSDSKDRQLCGLSTSELKNCFEMTLIGLKQALDFIENQNLDKPTRLDYISYLTGYFVFHAEETLTREEEKYIIDWYKNVSFTNKSNGERRNIFNNLIKDANSKNNYTRN